jgi:tRNA nucleotidyltransferase/poly(A) polymerase
MIKKCRECHEDKEINDFAKNKLTKDGHLNVCKVCDRHQKKEWYQKNKEHCQRKRKIWQEQNREKHNKHVREYYFRQKGAAPKLKIKEKITEKKQNKMDNSVYAGYKDWLDGN